MKSPILRPDGSCPDCLGGWLCKYHQQEGLRRDARKSQTIREAARALRAHNIARIMAQYELESDEFYTAEQKAIALL